MKSGDKSLGDKPGNEAGSLDVKCETITSDHFNTQVLINGEPDTSPCASPNQEVFKFLQLEGLSLSNNLSLTFHDLTKLDLTWSYPHTISTCVLFIAITALVYV